MGKWALLKCLECDFPFLINSKEYTEIRDGEYPFMTCPKCGKEQNISRDAFQRHVELPLTVKKVTKYLVSNK